MSLEVKNLKHAYFNQALNAQPVLDINRWRVRQGEQVLISGFSAGGKTTLMDILAGKLEPSSGSVWYQYQSLYGLSANQRANLCRSQIGYIHQMLRFPR